MHVAALFVRALFSNKIVSHVSSFGNFLKIGVGGRRVSERVPLSLRKGEKIRVFLNRSVCFPSFFLLFSPSVSISASSIDSFSSCLSQLFVGRFHGVFSLIMLLAFGSLRFFFLGASRCFLLLFVFFLFSDCVISLSVCRGFWFFARVLVFSCRGSRKNLV